MQVGRTDRFGHTARAPAAHERCEGRRHVSVTSDDQKPGTSYCARSNGRPLPRSGSDTLPLEDQEPMTPSMMEKCETRGQGAPSL
jgi:hypothetical protein